MKLEEALQARGRVALGWNLTNDVIHTLGGRKGFDEWWMSLDEDIRDEIEAALLTAILDRLTHEGITYA